MFTWERTVTNGSWSPLTDQDDLDGLSTDPNDLLTKPNDFLTALDDPDRFLRIFDQKNDKLIIEWPKKLQIIFKVGLILIITSL